MEGRLTQSGAVAFHTAAVPRGGVPVTGSAGFQVLSVPLVGGGNVLVALYVAMNCMRSLLIVRFISDRRARAVNFW